MKNRLLIFIYTILLCSNAFAEELFIEAKDITLNKEKKTSIFQNDVLVKTKIRKLLVNMLNTVKILKKLCLKKML